MNRFCIPLLSLTWLLAVLSMQCGKVAPTAGVPVIIEQAEPITDIDGNIYRTVKIGSQIWMAENLRCTRCSDGTPVQSLCYNNDTAYAAVYGRLYTWDAAVRNTAHSSDGAPIQGISPAGWHLPSSDEWRQLIDYLGGSGIAGGKMKSTGTQYWLNPNTGATNESGFGAHPAGFFRIDSVFIGLGEQAVFATSERLNSQYIRVYTLTNTGTSILAQQYLTQDALSIRCVRNSIGGTAQTRRQPADNHHAE